MSDLILRCAAALVRQWTRVYTHRMPIALREARRAEIDSDLWEFEDEARRRGDRPVTIAAHILVRLFLGVADDLSWRVEHRDGEIALRRTLWWFAAATLSLLAVFLWLFAPLAGPAAPSPPKRPNLDLAASAPTPGSPPPPPAGGVTPK